MLLDSTGSLKITDFGLALALRGAGRFGGATSQSGTPQFASPEQLLGEKVDQRTDLYSLAAVAFYALLGRPPFTGRHVAEILAKQTADRLPDLHLGPPRRGRAAGAGAGAGGAVRSRPALRERQRVLPGADLRGGRLEYGHRRTRRSGAGWPTDCSDEDPAHRVLDGFVTGSHILTVNPHIHAGSSGNHRDLRVRVRAGQSVFVLRETPACTE